ncbi:MAG TPA: hotdog domain-containing protein [Puia sp.]|nr:hotdog domain-containing protein [Puia sp.]
MPTVRLFAWRRVLTNVTRLRQTSNDGPSAKTPVASFVGGSLLRWIDEEAAIYTIIQLETNRCVTKFMSEINFINSARQGDIIELGIKAIHFGRTSLTLTCEVRNKITQKSILTIDKIVFVSVDEQGVPVPHGKTRITYTDERLRED